MSGLLSRPDRFLLVAGLLYGLGLAVVTPPFQVADEPAHFYRAYRVSEGRLDLIPRLGRGIAGLPASLQDVATSLRGDLPFHPERKIAPRKILAAFRVPLLPERRTHVWLANTLQYPFVPYVPQAFGIALGRAVGAPPLALLYLARLSNLVAGTLMIVLAVRRLPAFRWLAVMLALTPMALSLRASASADVTSTGAAFLLVATVAKLAWRRDEPPHGSDFILLLLSAVVLCTSKVAYLPLALLIFLIPQNRFPWRRTGFLLPHISTALAGAVFAVATSHAVGRLRFDAAVDSGRQIRDALAHPLSFLQIVVTDYVVHAPRYLLQLIGKLGWLDTKLPSAFLAAYIAVLLALVLLDTSPTIEVRPWQRWTVAALLLTTLVLISASQYAVWTAYGASYIEGLQGRYFIPLAPAAVWIFHSRRFADRIPPERLGAGLAAFSLLSFGISAWALVERFYVP